MSLPVRPAAIAGLTASSGHRISWLLLLLCLGVAITLSGCVAGMVAGAAGMAAKSAAPKPVNNEGQQPTAIGACSARASQYGTIRIIDVEQRSASKIVVYGTADGPTRQSFECEYGTKINGFKVRPLSKR